MSANFLSSLLKEKRKVPIYSKKKTQFFHKLQINKSKIYKFVYFIIIYLILVSLSKQILSDKYIEIKVNQGGIQQILSDDFTFSDSLPKVNSTSWNMAEKKINVYSKENFIKLSWDNSIKNFSHMFSNLKNINEVHIHNLLGLNNTFSYTFSNCTNLKKVTINGTYSKEHVIQNMKGMFYNCQSLETFSFRNLYLDYYEEKMETYEYDTYSETIPYYFYNNIDMSYMFYNCTNLKSITDINDAKYISDMSYLFYNCISLTTIDLKMFSTVDDFINTSFMFYNCQQLLPNRNLR